MEMSIDEAIIQSRIQLTIWEEGCESKLNSSPKAVETLIEIARKYQKIEQIIEHYKNNVKDKVTNENMEKILEVMEDGNVD